jgi:hypothetical protein
MVSEPGAVATGPRDVGELLGPVATAPGSDTAEPLNSPRLLGFLGRFGNNAYAYRINRGASPRHHQSKGVRNETFDFELLLLRRFWFAVRRFMPERCYPKTLAIISARQRNRSTARRVCRAWHCYVKRQSRRGTRVTLAYNLPRVRTGSVTIYVLWAISPDGHGNLESSSAAAAVHRFEDRCTTCCKRLLLLTAEPHFWSMLPAAWW